jgi:tetratricopeptide (TPR) repeat protein
VTARSRGETLSIAALLLAIALAYAGVATHDFVRFDDNYYVGEKAPTRLGLSLEGAVRALRSIYLSNWHPLTWLSLQLDWELFGLEAGGYLVENVALHGVAALLLYAALRRMTGAAWPSLFAAALWALHPLRVESVAWVSERKDVLSGVFAMAVLLAYARYAERTSMARWLAVAGLFALGLLAKPMLVTLPLALLLLDFWPLERIRRGAPIGQLVVEKLPLLALAAASATMTFLAHVVLGTAVTLERIPPIERLANALLAWVGYLGTTLWPVDLAAFYPHARDSISLAATLAAGVGLAAFSALAFALHRRAPYLLVGWLWYLGTLVPVIGIVQTGHQASADRYTYLPSVGLAIAFAWGCADLARRRPRAARALRAVALAVLAALAILTHLQVRTWRDTETLFGRALAVTPDNPLIHYYLGADFLERGDRAAARAQYEAALALEPDFVAIHDALADLLAGDGDAEGALAHYRHAARVASHSPTAHFNLGTYLLELGRYEEAIGPLAETVRLAPDTEGARTNLGRALAALERLDEALEQMEAALALEPDSAQAHFNLGNLLARQSRFEEARPHIERALELDPSLHDARVSLALLLSIEGERGAALAELEPVLAADPNHAVARALAARLAATASP